jgi:predicted nucleotidyltransferase
VPEAGWGIEGDFVETPEGLLFEVKGVQHPQDRLIAYVRYVPLETYGQISDDIREHPQGGQQYCKLYPIEDRYDFLRKHAPEYLYQPQGHSILYQAVPHRRITRIFRPNDYLQTCLTQRTPGDAADLCCYLSQESGAPLTAFGITGSQMLQLGEVASDLDLCVYGYYHALKVREVIRRCYQKGPQGPLRQYTLKEMRAHHQFRSGTNGVPFHLFLSHELRKLHQGYFRDLPFFIRYFEHADRERYREQTPLDDYSIRGLGRITLRAQVRDDSHWWTTPAQYGIGNVQVSETAGLTPDARPVLESHQLELADVEQITSLRGRFTEQVRLLELIEVEGALELVTAPGSHKPSLQVSLGAHPRDRLIYL